MSVDASSGPKGETSGVTGTTGGPETMFGRIRRRGPYILAG